MSEISIDSNEVPVPCECFDCFYRRKYFEKMLEIKELINKIDAMQNQLRAIAQQAEEGFSDDYKKEILMNINQDFMLDEKNKEVNFLRQEIDKLKEEIERCNKLKISIETERDRYLTLDKTNSELVRARTNLKETMQKISIASTFFQKISKKIVAGDKVLKNYLQQIEERKKENISLLEKNNKLNSLNNDILKKVEVYKTMPKIKEFTTDTGLQKEVIKNGERKQIIWI